MIALMICKVCDAQLELSDQEVVAAAEVATFAEAHGREHDRYAFSVRVADRTSTFTYGAGASRGRPGT